MKKQQVSKESGHYWKSCPGCKDGHSSFWKTITESPEWSAWYDEQRRRFTKLADGKEVDEVYDIDESMECGWIGKEHWASFVKFIKNKKTRDDHCL